MASIELNILQERELGRLLDYERATCTVDGELVYRCAFPLRPDDDLQRELIERGALAKRPDDRRGTVVAITTDGYSYFPAKRKEQEERNMQLLSTSGTMVNGGWTGRENYELNE